VLAGIRARVTKSFLAKIGRPGGIGVSFSTRYHDIRAHLPLEKLEELAALKDVSAHHACGDGHDKSTQIRRRISDRLALSVLIFIHLIQTPKESPSK